MTRSASPQDDRRARIHRIAVETLGSEAHARAWLSRPLAILDGKAPREMLATEAGARAVEQALGRLEHGVFG